MVSHGESWRDTCAARGVTDLAIGSSDWLGIGTEDKLPIANVDPLPKLPANLAEVRYLFESERLMKPLARHIW